MNLMSKILLLLLITATPAFARTISEQKFTCPIDSRQFVETISTSGTSFGAMLDYQEYGPIASPWEQPQCPGDGFVLFKDKFTKEELDILRPYVNSVEYQDMWRNKETSYWLKAKCMEKLGTPLADRADALLMATWEARPVFEQYRRYAPVALAAQKALLEKGGLKKNHEEATRLLIGEFHRRLGNFAEAKQYFTALAQEPDFKGNERYMRIITLQLELIEKQDIASHRIPK